MMNGTCVKCGLSTPNEVVILREPPDCPGCGGRAFTMTFEVTETFLPHNTTVIKQKDPNRNSKKRVRREHFNGMQANSQGLLMRKERLIDKDSDVYYEFVADPNTGEVLRKEHGRLSDHQGYGSAKQKKTDT
ncbi:hypothetical protein [Undibacterium flavidum]|nr:hypothetical protein [Undibacterium flavidum]